MKRTVSVVALLGAFTQVAAAGEPIKVGLVLSYSGQFAEPAQNMDNGIVLYNKQHGGEVCGRPIEIIRRDSGGAPPDVAARLSSEMIVRDNVDVLAGYVSSAEAFAAGPISQQAKKFTVLLNAQASEAVGASPYMVRVSATTPQINKPLGEWVAKHGVKQVYTLVTDFKPGQDAEKAFIEAFTANGGKVIASDRSPLNNPDYSAFALRIKSANPEAIFVWPTGGEAATALGKALYQRGLVPPETKVFSQGELTTEDALANMGEAALGVITAFHYTYERSSPENDAFVDAYRKEFRNENPDAFSVSGYDGMHLIYEALKKTNCSSDGQALIQAAKGLSWTSPRGNITINPETRDVVQTIWIREVQRVDGKIRNVVIDQIDNVKDPVRTKE